MINNSDILLSAVNETFANDMTQQYCTLQITSTYIPQPVQQMPQKQQSKTQVIEVFLTEVNELKSRVKKLEELSQQRAQHQMLEILPIQIPIRLACSDRNAFFTSEKPKKYHAWSCQNVCDALTFLLDNIFIRFGTKLYRQVVGIPMGTNCAPLVADLFLLL